MHTRDTINNLIVFLILSSCSLYLCNNIPMTNIRTRSLFPLAAHLLPQTRLAMLKKTSMTASEQAKHSLSVLLLMDSKWRFRICQTKLASVLFRARSSVDN